jgi:hypothetical protein
LPKATLRALAVHHDAVEGSGDDNMREEVAVAACDHVEKDGEGDEEDTCMEYLQGQPLGVDDVDHAVPVVVGKGILLLPENGAGMTDAQMDGVHTPVEVDGEKMWPGYMDHLAIERAATAAD